MLQLGPFKSDLSLRLGLGLGFRAAGCPPYNFKLESEEHISRVSTHFRPTAIFLLDIVGFRLVWTHTATRPKAAKLHLDFSVLHSRRHGTIPVGFSGPWVVLGWRLPFPWPNFEGRITIDAGSNVQITTHLLRSEISAYHSRIHTSPCSNVYRRSRNAASTKISPSYGSFLLFLHTHQFLASCPTNLRASSRSASIVSSGSRFSFCRSVFLDSFAGSTCESVSPSLVRPWPCPRLGWLYDHLSLTRRPRILQVVSNHQISSLRTREDANPPRLPKPSAEGTKPDIHTALFDRPNHPPPTKLRKVRHLIVNIDGTFESIQRQ